MNTKLKRLLAVIYIFLLASCNKYLDVQPVDKLLDKQVFSSRSSIQKALNGIYINMVSPGLYGGHLTATTLDVLAQYYTIPDRNTFVAASRYNFQDGGNLQNTLSTIWSGTFTAILNINQFIQGVSESSAGGLVQDEKDLVLGEAYGLRAFLAFDMLRLYGPVYSVDSTSAMVPYPTLPETQLSELLPANQFMDAVIKDLHMAATLLANDPIIKSGILPLDSEDISNNFFRARNRRMNYYAVKSLLARVYLYRGDTRNALQNAEEVIGIAGSIFPWTPEPASRNGIPNPDRLFSSEIIFGPENTQRDQLYQNFFAASNYQQSPNASIDFAKLLAPSSERLTAIYENEDNDFRLRSSWAIDRSADYSFKTATKYAPSTANYLGVYPVFRNIQPLIRLSELYYIAAECTGDKQQAANYLNTVRTNRGLLNPVPATADLEAAIFKEYRKECWGEGQLFFYYKRKYFKEIESGSGSTPIPMTTSKYIAPLPLGETQYR